MEYEKLQQLRFLLRTACEEEVCKKSFDEAQVYHNAARAVELRIGGELLKDSLGEG